jgi:hypothetical protein
MEVRGGKGNRVILHYNVGHSKGDYLEKLENRMLETLSFNTSEIPNYFDETTHPKEWNNIEKGSDLFKLTKKDKLFLISLGGIVTGLIIIAIILIF